MKRFLLSVLAVSLVVACSKQKDNMTVSGKVNGLKKGMLYFQTYQDTTLVTLDSIEIKGDPSFRFSTYVESPQLFYLHLEKNDGNELNDDLEFFGEPGDITIETSYDYFAAEAVISGSPSQDDMDEYNKINRKFIDKNLQLVTARLQAQKDGKTEVADSLAAELDKNATRRYLYTLNFIFTHKDSYVAPYLVLSETNNLSVKYLDSIQSVLTPRVASSVYGKALADFTEKVKALESDDVSLEGTDEAENAMP